MNVLKKITSFGAKVGFKIAQHSPALFVYGGLVLLGGGMIATGIAASKTSKIKEEKAKEKQRIEDNKARAMEITADPSAEEKNPEEVSWAVDYIEQGYKKEIFNMHRHIAWSYIKMFLPAFAFAAGGTACILTGHHILNTRYTLMVGAYTTLQTSYSRYRQTVAEKYGIETENELFDASDKKIISEMQDNSETSNTNKKPAMDLDFYNLYSVRFSKDECPSLWRNNAASNLHLLRSHLYVLNDLLNARGWVSLNDALDEFDFPPCQSGTIFGWVKDKNNPLRHNHIDIGIDPETNPDPELLDFLATASSPDPRNGTKEITLRFNVDPIPIHYAMPEKINTFNDVFS